MAVIIGGLHGRARGNVGGIIYGAARSRAGKVVTARELVIPANPNTAAQQNQRSKFASVLDTVRAIGPDTYRDNWNRSVGQLPGFHSLESILLHVISDEDVYDEAPPDTPLGTLHFPNEYAVTSEAVGTIDITFSNEFGDNGVSSDVVDGFAIAATAVEDAPHAVHHIVGTPTRNDSPVVIDTVLDVTDYMVVVWLRGALLGTARLSKAQWDLVTTQ